MRDLCTDCYNTIDSCICNDFDAEIQRLVKKNNKIMLENENLHREMNKMNEFKENILSANQALTDHIKKLNQEIENLKYKNTYLTECALEDQKRLQEKREWLIEETLEWLKLENKAGDLAIKTLEQEVAKLKDELKKLLSLHCERCEDPAECNLCGWHLVTKELIK